MPELPEVQSVVTSIRSRLLGRTISRVDLRRRDILDPPDFDLAAQITGRTIADIHRRGKRIVFRLDDENQFYIHLGMTGRLSLHKPAVDFASHTHLVFDVAERDGSAVQLRFADPRRFGGVFWLGLSDAAGIMGPEPLTVTPPQLAERLSRTTRAIKNALLDQTLIAGLGNIYVDESLFTSGIHPLIRADKLSKEQIARLNRAIKATLRKAINHRGSTLRDYRDADGTPGGFQKLHRVYGREGDACRICKTAIVRIVLGGRSTHFCPKCQSRGKKG
jgi:formamidopyrimidine-DNA glycosylase